MTVRGSNLPTSVRAARQRVAIAFGTLAAGVFLAGTALGPDFDSPLKPAAEIGFLCAAAALGGASLALKSHFAGVCLGLALVLLGFAWGAHRLARVSVAPRLGAVVRLTALEHAQRTSTGRWSCLAAIRGAPQGWPDAPAGSSVWVSMPGDAHPPAPGDRVIALADFVPVDPPANPGEFNLRRWANDRGILGTLRVQTGLQLRPDESAPGFMERLRDSARRLIGTLRARASGVVDRLGEQCTPEGRELLRGLLLGENPQSQGLAPFYQLGLAHILSISGFHLAVFAGAALFALRLAGDLGRLEPLLVALAIALFLLLVPPSSPLVRAAAILLTLLGAEYLGRRYDRLTLLGWIACVVLLARPSELWSLGFQLSFGLTAVLLGMGQRLAERLFPGPLGLGSTQPKLAARLRGAVGVLFATSALCWAISAPWIASTIGVLNPLAILTTMVLTPLIVLLLWAGYAVLLSGLVLPGLASVLAAPVALLVTFIVACAAWFDSLAVASIALPPVPAAWALAATLLLVFWFASARLRQRGFACAAGALVVFLLLTWWMSGLPSNVAARVHNLAIRRGSCSLVETPGGNWMINAGAGSDRGRNLASVARALGIWRVETLVIDGAIPSNAEGAPEVLRSLKPKRVLLVGHLPPEQDEAVRQAAALWGIPITESTALEKALSELPAACLPILQSASSGRLVTVDLAETAR